MRALTLGLILLAACNGGASSATPPDQGMDAGPGADAAAGTDVRTEAGASARITLTNTTAAGGNPLLWAAFNDGDGAWQALTGAGPEYPFEVRNGRYGLAFVCKASNDQAHLGEVVHATVGELPGLTVDCGEPPSTKVALVTGKISGLPAGASVDVQLGGYRLPTIDPPATSYQFAVPPGTRHLAAFATVGDKVTRAFLRRDLAVATGAMVDLDFAQGVAMVEQPLDILGGAGTTELGAAMGLQTTRTDFVWGDETLTPSSKTYSALPGAALQPGETQRLAVLGIGGSPEAFSVRAVIRGFREPRPAEVTLPPAFPSAKVTAAATTPNLRPRTNFQPYAGALFYQLVADQISNTRATSWLAIFSAAWLGNRQSYELPDFGAVPGYRADFGFQPGMTLQGRSEAVMSSRDFARTINDDPATRDGAELKYAQQGFLLAP